jgi:hypothetical protein
MLYGTTYGKLFTTPTLPSLEGKSTKVLTGLKSNGKKLDPVIVAKRKALIAYKASPSPTTLQQLRTARNTEKRTAQLCANTYWTDLCRSVQTAADLGNTRE